MERCTEADGDAESYEGRDGREAPGANSGSL